MSGLKNKGQLGVSENGMGGLNTLLSSVNFFVPNKDILDESDELLKKNCRSHGIMTGIIKAIASKTRTPSQTTFKISFDLKKKT